MMSTKARLLVMIWAMSITLFATPILAQTGVEYPVAIDTFLTVVGVAVFASLLMQWAKQGLGDWRWNQFLVLLLSMILAALAAMIKHAWHPDPTAMWEALMTGFFGASVATFGYESTMNIRGAMGRGSRSDAALLEDAKALVESHGN